MMKRQVRRQWDFMSSRWRRYFLMANFLLSLWAEMVQVMMAVRVRQPTNKVIIRAGNEHREVFTIMEKAPSRLFVSSSS